MNDHDAEQTVESGTVWGDLSETERRELDGYERDRLLDQVSELKREVTELRSRLDKLTERIEMTREVNSLWDGS